MHCVKSVRVRSFSGPHFAAFGLNTEKHSVSLSIQSECGKMRTRKTPNTDTFCALMLVELKVIGKTNLLRIAYNITSFYYSQKKRKGYV